MTDVWWPIHTAMPRRPWQLINQDGESYRYPPEGRLHQAYTFDTASQALKLAAKKRLVLATTINQENAPVE